LKEIDIEKRNAPREGGKGSTSEESNGAATNLSIGREDDIESEW